MSRAAYLTLSMPRKIDKGNPKHRSETLPETFGRPFAASIISLIAEKDNAGNKHKRDGYDDMNPEMYCTRQEPLAQSEKTGCED
jgi:hypothetical protein